MQVPIELRIRKDTSFLIESSVVFGFEVPKHGCRNYLRNLKPTTLAGPVFPRTGGPSTHAR